MRITKLIMLGSSRFLKQLLKNNSSPVDRKDAAVLLEAESL
jgi:hypothetical protein